MITLALGEGGDWLAVYKDGQRVYEGHDIEPEQLLQLAGVEHAVASNIDCSQFGNRLPRELADLDAQMELGNACFDKWSPS